MDFGIGYFPTADAVGPGELAAFVEERGFASLVFAEHTHIPASRESPYPGGGELPRKYTATLDLFVALTAAALATSRLRVGSGISLVIQRDPIITAKEVASIDVLSGGASTSASAPAGTARRWPTTAPTRARACASSPSGSKR
jgi:alkanesulfonate monooxygenase SsuD/methylene tetrahydromethanopterin reductase-like flavin-dependent oxidoreductase (luciferase family)